MQSLRDELITAGTALAPSHMSLPTNEMEPEQTSSQRMGILDSDDIDVDLNVYEEEILYAMERERGKLKVLEELQQSIREITMAKQGQADAQTTIGQVTEKVDYEGGQPSTDGAASPLVQHEATNGDGSHVASGLSVLGDKESSVVPVEGKVKHVPSLPSLEVPSSSKDMSKVQVVDDASANGSTDYEDDDVKPDNVEMFTFEEYERKVQKLLDIEKEELLETEAILNARPGADIEVPEKERHKDSFTNATAVGSASVPDHLDSDGISSGVEDDNAFSGDETLVEDRSQPEGLLLQTKETSVDKQVSDPAAMMIEFLETEAILNARPGADGFERTEKERNAGMMVNATHEESPSSPDDLSILEMDEPSTLIADSSSNDAADFPIAESTTPKTIEQQNQTQSSFDGSTDRERLNRTG
jgi:hypothetical protein